MRQRGQSGFEGAAGVAVLTHQQARPARQAPVQSLEGQPHDQLQPAGRGWRQAQPGQRSEHRLPLAGSGQLSPSLQMTGRTKEAPNVKNRTPSLPLWALRRAQSGCLPCAEMPCNWPTCTCRRLRTSLMERGSPGREPLAGSDGGGSRRQAAPRGRASSANGLQVRFCMNGCMKYSSFSFDT